MTEQWYFTHSKSDSSLFYRSYDSHILLVLVYANDIIITGSNSQIVLKVISDMQNTFALQDLRELNYFFCVEVNKTKEGIHLSQSKYIVDLLVKNGMYKCSLVPTPMATSHSLIKNSGPVIENV